MRKVLMATCCLLLFSSLLMAQKRKGLGVAAGAVAAYYSAQKEYLQFNGSSLSNYALKNRSDNMIGFTAGFTGFFDLDKNWSIKTGINFLQKGGKVFLGSETRTTRLNYLNIPFQFLYKIKAGKGDFLIGTGPSLDLGMFGTRKKEGGDIASTIKIDFGNNVTSLKRVDLSEEFVVGYLFNSGWGITGFYSVGLTNASNISGAPWKNRVLGLKVELLDWNFWK